MSALQFLRGTNLWRSVLEAVEASRGRKGLQETQAAQETRNKDADTSMNTSPHLNPTPAISPPKYTQALSDAMVIESGGGGSSWGDEDEHFSRQKKRKQARAGVASSIVDQTKALSAGAEGIKAISTPAHKRTRVAEELVRADMRERRRLFFSALVLQKPNRQELLQMTQAEELFHTCSALASTVRTATPCAHNITPFKQVAPRANVVDEGDAASATPASSPSSSGSQEEF